MDEMKNQLCLEVERCSEPWVELSDRIHANPETNFCEVKAARWLCDGFRQLGFSVETGVAEIGTAFIARLKGRDTGPKIGILIEYDAIEGVGHACAHNTKGPAVLAGVQAFLRLFPVFRGEIIAYGCPAEEGGGGKILMSNAGVFQEADLCLEMAAGPLFSTGNRSFALQSMKISFKGKSGHAGRPELHTVNALEPLLYTLCQLDYIRKYLGSKGLVHSIITEGGIAASVVPDSCSAAINVRAVSRSVLEETTAQIEAVASFAGRVSGTQLEINKGLMYLEYRKCASLASLVQRNLEALGVSVEWLLDKEPRASTDVGNVSQLVPTERICIGLGAGLVPHTEEYKVACGSEPGHSVVVNGGKALAMCLKDLLVDDSAKLVSSIKSEFKDGQAAAK